MANSKLNSALLELTTEALEAEIAARKLKQQQAPKPLDNPDWDKLKRFVVGSIEELAKGRTIDFDHFVFEEVLMTIYGKDIWEWWNKGLSSRG